MNIGSNFTGIGSWEKSLQKLGIDYDLKFFSEIDKYAVKSYCAIHDVSQELNIGDITICNPEELDDIDMLVYSPPCQAFSQAGKQLGFEDKRGILFFESLKIIQEKKPKFALMENVKGLSTKKFKDEFEIMLEELDKAGYNNYHKVLNAKDYGIPQNRERIFIISIRKDIDRGFEFPEKFDNGIRLKDILQTEVDEKYYLSDDKAQKLLEQLEGLQLGENPILINTKMKELEIKDKGIFCCITASMYKEPPTIIQMGNIYPSGGQNGNVYNPNGIAPTLSSGQGITGSGIGSNNSPKIIEMIEEFNPVILHNIYGGFNEDKPKKVKGIVDISNTLTAQDPLRTLGNNNPITGIVTNNSKRRFRIRKLTPMECWRLMGFNDVDFIKAKNAGISDTQLYKMAGNSIVVDVPYYIFKVLKEIYSEHFNDDINSTSLFSEIDVACEYKPNTVESNNLIKVGEFEGKFSQNGRVYDSNGICPTLMAGERKTCTGGYIAPKVLVGSQ